MAHFKKVKRGARAQVWMLGVRDSKTLPTMAEARQWAAMREAEIISGAACKWPRKTVSQAMARYLAEVSARKAPGAVEREGKRFAALERDFPALAGKLVHEVTTADFAAWREARLAVVTPGTVERDLNLLSNLFRVASRDWEWCEGSPISKLRRPGDNPPSQATIGWRQIRAVLRRLRYRRGAEPVSKGQEVALMWMVALASAMRVGELVSLTAARINLAKGLATVPHKMQYLTGKPRAVPLTGRARRLLACVAHRDGPTFRVSASSRDALFRKAMAQAGVDGFTFRDARAFALTLLARKHDPLTVARIAGHADIRELHRTYYREADEAIAARLR